MRNGTLRFAASLAVSLALTSCAQFKSITKQKTFDKHDSQAVFVDAKQRAVFIHKREGKDGALSICAEPSPDALSVIAATAGVDVTTKAGFNAAANFASSEAGGSIGLRTQSIQLMRDAMFRLCEGYSSGALDAAAFETLHRRFQQSMVTILAVEQLTGVARAPALVLVGGASTGGETIRSATTDARAARNELDRLKGELESTQSELEEKTAAHTAIKDDVSKKTEAEALQTKLTKLREKETTQQQSVSEAQESYDKNQALRSEAIRRGGEAGGAGGLLGGPAQGVSDAAAKHISSAVTAIVEDYNELSFIEEVCTTTFTNFLDGKVGDGKFELLSKPIFASSESLFDLCVVRLGKDIKEQEEKFTLAEERLKAAREDVSLQRQMNKDLRADTKKINNALSDKVEEVEVLAREALDASSELSVMSKLVSWFAGDVVSVQAFCQNAEVRKQILGENILENDCNQQLAVFIHEDSIGLDKKINNLSRTQYQLQELLELAERINN
jgi:hypothetical protein